MPESFFSMGYEAIQNILSDFLDVVHWFDEVRWSDLYGWMNLPSDISQAITLIIGLFITFCLVGFVRKIVVFFG